MLLPAYSWGSHASPLAREIRQPTVPEHRDIRLSENEFHCVMTWLDLNGVYYPTYACAYPNSLTGRCPLSSGQLGRLAQLAGIDLGRTRDHQSNLGPQVNFDRPQLSSCLAQFTSAQDPAYQESLAIIQAGKAMLAQRPRADMPGFQACDADHDREVKYAARQQAEARSREAIRTGGKVYD